MVLRIVGSYFSELIVVIAVGLAQGQRRDGRDFDEVARGRGRFERLAHDDTRARARIRDHRATGTFSVA